MKACPLVALRMTVVVVVMVKTCGLMCLRQGSRDKPVPAAGDVVCSSSSASMSILIRLVGECPIRGGPSPLLLAYALFQECVQRRRRDEFR